MKSDSLTIGTVVLKMIVGMVGMLVGIPCIKIFQNFDLGVLGHKLSSLSLQCSFCGFSTECRHMPKIQCFFY